MTPHQLPHSPPPSQLTVGDIYNIVFKHKRLILVLSFLGIATAIAIFFVQPPPYISQAKLAVRYVEDNKAMTGPGIDGQVRPVNSQPEGVLESEATILTSLDVAAAAADAIGVEKIVGKSTGRTNREYAAWLIRENLNVEVPKRGNVLAITYKNADITLVQPVLRKLIEAYYKKHVEIHKNLGVLDNFLTEETDRLAQSLRQTEEELRALKSRAGGAGVVSLEETRKVYTDRYTKLREDLDTAEADLSGRIAAVKEMQKAMLGGPLTTAGSTSNIQAVSVQPKLSAEVSAEYKKISARLQAAINQETEFLLTYTPESPRLKEVSDKIASLKKEKTQMEAANPGLLSEQSVTSRTENDDISRPPAMNLTAEYARVAALQAQIAALTNQVARIKAEAGVVDDIETQYTALQRKKEQQESQYKYYSKSLDQARVDSQLGTGKLSNINEIQSPSLPLRDMKSLKKKMAMAGAGGIGGGLAFAFLLEFVLSQGIRRPSELETSYNIPLFLTIPELDRTAKPKPAAFLLGPSAAPTTNGDGEEPNGTANGHSLVGREASVEVAHCDHHDLQPYSEALRDRLINYFEMKGLTHKPKLVALTSCSRGAGVTTLAAGLAASLSETGEGNVLLVDMNIENGAAHPFYRGKPTCGIAELLNGDNRQQAQVQENLYLVHGTGMDDRLPKMLPKRLAHLLPKLHASDYDYIIFDMPPVSHTSVTPRLASFMDMVFLVVEGEKTNREWLKQANGLLKQSKANVAAVFNKRREYTPRWLHQEF